MITGKEIDLNVDKENTYVYARVSTPERKGDLERQVKKLLEAVQDDGRTCSGVFKDIGSGINDKRRNLNRLLKYCITGKHDVGYVYVTYRDRLARFGSHIIELLLQTKGITLVEINKPDLDTTDTRKRLKALHEEFIQDFMSFIASFSGKYYRLFYSAACAAGSNCACCSTPAAGYAGLCFIAG